MRGILVLKLERSNKQKRETEYYFKDGDDNTYIWNTRTKFDKPLGKVVSVRATVEPVRYGEKIIRYIMKNVRLA